jgi:putative DNA primase/helicase
VKLYNGVLQDAQTVTFGVKQERESLATDWASLSGIVVDEVKHALLDIEDQVETALRQLEAASHTAPGPRDPWRQHLLMTREGDPKECASNYTLFFSEHAEWQGRLWWDVVHERAMWGMESIDTAMVSRIAAWLGMHERLAVHNLTLLRQQLTAVCQATPRDVIQEWLTGLPPWDGTPRLETWLLRAGNAADTPVNHFISRLIPLSLVHRAFHPGTMYRYVVIVEGDEDIGKSKLLRQLGAPWAKSLSAKLDSKEAYMQLKGVWLAEFAELEALGKADEARIKAFISDVVDHYVPKYENNPTDQKRRTVFVGTINEQEYLKGTTGNTRFFPIKVYAPLDEQYLTAIREQLFAEAMVFLAQPTNDTWWHIPEAIQGELADLREERRVPNPYVDHLYTWLEQHTITTEISWDRLATEYLELPKEKWKDLPLQHKMGEAMRLLGWESKVIRPKSTPTILRPRPYRAWVSTNHRLHSKHPTCPQCGAQVQKTIATSTGHSCLSCLHQWACLSCR